MTAASHDPDAAFILRGIVQDFTLSSWKKHVVRALDHVDLRVDMGEVVGIVGESGSGKTTLLRIMLNLLQPTAGEVIFRGKPVTEWTRRAYGRQVQMVFQDPYSSLNPRRTIEAIVRQPLEVHGIGARSEQRRRVRELLDMVGLGERFLNVQPRQLSGGQRQRVVIARALALKPAVVILDEPTSALDVSVQAQILNLLNDLRDELKLTYVFVSHNLSVIEHMSDKVYVLERGRVVESGAPAQIFHSPRNEYTKALVHSVLTVDPGVGLPQLPDRRPAVEAT